MLTSVVRFAWLVALLVMLSKPSLGCMCVGSSSVCGAVATSEVVFVGTVDSVNTIIPDPEDLAVQRQMHNLFSDEELENLREDKSPGGVSKLKDAYLRMYPYLPEPYKTQLLHATTYEAVEALLDSMAETGRRTHFKVKEVFRGP